MSLLPSQPSPGPEGAGKPRGPVPSAKLPVEFREPHSVRPLSYTSAPDDLSDLQTSQLLRLIEHINQCVDLEQVLNELYDQIPAIIPCDRIGLALLEGNGTSAVSRWAKSNRPIHLAVGYKAPLAGSSLLTILQSGNVRIINDLAAYAQDHPHSNSTRLLLAEGMLASLTCPLLVKERPVGFLFFTSAQRNAYSKAQLRFYQNIATHISVVIEKARLYDELASYTLAIANQNKRMLAELEMARQIQQTLIPREPPHITGLDISLLYQPAAEVGGDLLEFVSLDHSQLLIFMADAMGHGVPAAMTMAAVKAMFLAVCKQTTDPAAILQQLNRSLPPLLEKQFAAALAMLIDPSRHRVTIARAGLPPPILINASDGRARIIEEGGLPLSLDASEPYHSTVLDMCDNDLIVLATDGLTETGNSSGDAYGMDNLVRIGSSCLHLATQEALNHIVADLNTFRGSSAVNDDMAIVLIRSAKIE